MKEKPKLIVLTGAGVSAESGIATFREAGGLWHKYDIMEVASPKGWEANPGLVLDFYNQRRRKLHEVEPNPGHLSLVELEEVYEVMVITQNIDDLHERAGSSKVIHLHGELFKAQSTAYPRLVYDWKQDLNIGDVCEMGSQLRPHVVWFGEAVPMLEVAALEIGGADKVLVIGSSMQVYPAAGLVGYAPPEAEVFYVDPAPAVNYELSVRKALRVVAEPASVGVPRVVDELLGRS